MIDNWINIIGGYNSWQFTTLFFSTLAIGGALYIFRWYLFPAMVFNTVLAYSWLHNYASIMAEDSGNQSVYILPAIYVIMVILALIKLKATQSNKTRNNNLESKPRNQQR